MGDWGVNSEVDKLKAVLMRRPGKEIENFDAREVRFSEEPIDIELMRKQHDGVAKIYEDFWYKGLLRGGTEGGPAQCGILPRPDVHDARAILTRPGNGGQAGEELYRTGSG